MADPEPLNRIGPRTQLTAALFRRVREAERPRESGRGPQAKPPSAREPSSPKPPAPSPSQQSLPLASPSSFFISLPPWPALLLRIPDQICPFAGFSASASASAAASRLSLLRALSSLPVRPPGRRLTCLFSAAPSPFPPSIHCTRFHKQSDCGLVRLESNPRCCCVVPLN